MYAIGQAARLYFTGGGFNDIILVTFGANISVYHTKQPLTVIFLGSSSSTLEYSFSNT